MNKKRDMAITSAPCGDRKEEFPYYQECDMAQWGQYCGELGSLSNTSHLGEEGPRSAGCAAVSLVGERWGGRE